MWAESAGLDFFLARLSGVPAARFLFVVGGEVRRLAVDLSLCGAVFIAFTLVACAAVCASWWLLG